MNREPVVAFVAFFCWLGIALCIAVAIALNGLAS